MEHKGICLKINCKQTVKLESSFTEFRNYSRQTPAPFEIYTDLECILKSAKRNEVFYKEYQNHIPCSFSCKLVYVDNRFSEPMFV